MALVDFSKIGADIIEIDSLCFVRYGCFDLDLLNQRDELVTAARHISLILTRQSARDATAAT